MIRQITINCAERGFLLVRVRDEFRQQLAAYQGLYDSSIAYGMRQALVAETSRTAILEKEKKLQDDIEHFTGQIADLETRCKDLVKEDEEIRAELSEEHAKYKEEQAHVVAEIKDKIDDCLKNPNIIV